MHKHQSLIDRMVAGERVVVSDETLDELDDHPMAVEIASCYNARRLGLRDTYVAWIGKENRPVDLCYRNDRTKGQVAVGSA